MNSPNGNSDIGPSWDLACCNLSDIWTNNDELIIETSSIIRYLIKLQIHCSLSSFIVQFLVRSIVKKWIVWPSMFRAAAPVGASTIISCLWFNLSNS